MLRASISSGSYGQITWISARVIPLELEDFTPHIVEEIWLFGLASFAGRASSDAAILTRSASNFFLLYDYVRVFEVRSLLLWEFSKRFHRESFAILEWTFICTRSIPYNFDTIYLSELFISNLLVDCIKSKSNVSVLLYLFDFSECRRSLRHSECSWSQCLFHLECFHYLSDTLNESSRIFCEGLDRLLDWLDCFTIYSDYLWIGAWSCYLIGVLDCVHIIEVHLSKRRELRINKSQIDKLWYCTLLWSYLFRHCYSEWIATLCSVPLHIDDCCHWYTFELLLFEYWFYLYRSQGLLASWLRVTI